MKVVIASDASGFRLKEAVKKHLIENGHEVADKGQLSENEPVMYYDAVESLAKTIQSGEFEKGIVICGTGAGVSLTANKFKGIYCVACESIFTAERISLINNANVLAMGENVVSYYMAGEMADKFLSQKWCDGFDAARRERNENGYAKLKKIEKENY
jgi:ribose 5-phosphate isomerase B